MKKGIFEHNTDFKGTFNTLKVLVMFFVIVPIMQKIFSHGSDEEVIILNLSKMMAFLAMIILVFIVYFIFTTEFKHGLFRRIMEITLLSGVCVLCFAFTGFYASPYKFVFAMLILIYTMELGLQAGLIFASSSGAVILLGDILTCPPVQRTNVFQSDLMLAGTFFILAYFVGVYVRKEQEMITKLNESVKRDSLTGLFNHRYFHEYMHKRIDDKSSRSEYLIMLDIDYFKVYNDTLGHLNGDTVLKDISDICTETVKGGTVFRYGGEEFAVHYYADDDASAFDAADKVRCNVAAHRFEGEELMPGHQLTVSIGLAKREGLDDTVADWIERADNALYKAKALRKNCVQVYSSVYDRFTDIEEISDDDRIISIKALLSVINSRDRYTYNHTDRVVHYCEVFSKNAKLDKKRTKTLLYAAYLHDIGKINVPQEILISEKRLNDAEWAMMKRHPSDGAEIVRKIKDFEEIAKIVQQHHEKFDGSGYPNGLKGKDISYLARILTLADSFDAMTAKRPYQKVKTFEEAFDEIRRCKGIHFDPVLAEKFIEAINKTFG